MSPALILFSILVCAALAGTIAGMRGASVALGVIVGLLLGPIGVLIACVLPRRRVETVATGAPMKRCPFCAEAIQPAARVCRYCNRELVVPDSASPEKA